LVADGLDLKSVDDEYEECRGGNCQISIQNTHAVIQAYLFKKQSSRPLPIIGLNELENIIVGDSNTQNAQKGKNLFHKDRV